MLHWHLSYPPVIRCMYPTITEQTGFFALLDPDASPHWHQACPAWKLQIEDEQVKTIANISEDKTETGYKSDSQFKR